MTLAFETNLVNPDLIPSHAGPPHALFAAWRARDPVHWNPAPENYHPLGYGLTQGFWVLTGYQDVFDASRDQELFSSHVGSPVIWDVEGEQLAQQQAGLMAMTPDQHSQMKRLILPPFAVRAISEFEPQIERAAREIIDGVAAKGSCEFVFDVASKLPVYTFCTVMGIPEADRDHIFNLGNAAADVESGRAVEMEVGPQLFAYAWQLAEAKRQTPDASIMSALVNGCIDGEMLSQPQVGMFFVTMSIAGHETTRSTAAHFIRLMNEHPDQYELIRTDPDRYLPNAIEEVLRVSPPVIQFRRTATRDTEIGGRSIKKGDKIYLSYPAANRDPTVFADPDRFDITRENASKHLSFGTGPHVCLGARLARLQLKLLLKEIITRIPDIRMSQTPEFLRTIWFNAIIDMPVIFTPETRS
jgi:cytochrome P450